MMPFLELGPLELLRAAVDALGEDEVQGRQREALVEERAVLGELREVLVRQALARVRPAEGAVLVEALPQPAPREAAGLRDHGTTR